MARRTAIDELDDAVDALMADPSGPVPRLTPRLAALLRIAGDLRDLPRAAFKEHLAAELRTAAGAAGTAPGAAPARAGRALRTTADMLARLEDLAAGPTFDTHDLRAALSDLPELGMRFLATLNQCTVGVSRFSTRTGWERHPAADELLHILEGEVEVTALTEGGPVHSTVRAGSLVICPRGLWHRLVPRSPVSMLFATPGEGTEHSRAKDPERGARRRAPARRSSGARHRGADTALASYDVAAALRSVPALAIAPDTTAAEADAAFCELTSFNQCKLFVGRFSGQSPWERHPAGDELLHVLDGEADLTVLADRGPVNRTLRAGSIFVCPRGLWHRQHSARGVTAIYATPSPTQVSWAEDPRHGEHS